MPIKIRKNSLKLLLAAAACLVFAAAVWSARLAHRHGILVDDSKFAEEIRIVSQKYSVDPQLIRAVVFQESRFDSRAVGKKGEVGLMQVLRSGAAKDWARIHRKEVPSHASLMDAKLNLEIGVWYLAAALKRWKAYKHGVELALIQYNAGEGRAVRWKPESFDGDVISRIKIASTRGYVVSIMNRYHKYTQEK